jgi:ribosomal protein S12 methylthiotransferase accessory factor
MRKPIAGWAAGHPIVSLLHDASVTSHADPDHEASPRACKSYARMPHVLLPPPEPLSESLETALSNRCSSLGIDGSRPLPIAALGSLLHWSVGRRRRGATSWSDARFFPSAGALYPLELYVIARAVTALPSALYHWDDVRHALERLPAASDAVETIYESLRFPWHRNAAAIAVVTARPRRMLAAYGARGYRFVLLEAGTVLQNLGLVTATLGLAGGAIGTNLDRAVEDSLRLDADDEVFLTAFAVGSPGGDRPGRDECRDIVAAARRAVGPLHASVVAPVAAVPIAALPVPDGMSCLPGVAAVTAAARVLGTRLFAELPVGLQLVPPDLWPAYATLRRFEASGVPLVWGPITPRPDEPKFHGYRVMLGSVDGGAGTDVSSPVVALAKAASEAVERFVWCERPPSRARLRVATSAELGTAALDLARLAGYGKQLRARHPARLAWDATTSFTWIEAQSLTRGVPTWVPLQIVTSAGPEPRGAAAREPELRPRITTGVAAHPDRTSAILNALREVIERDAAMLAWLARRPGGAIDPGSLGDHDVQELVSRFADAGLSYALARLVSDAPVPVVVAALRDPTGVGPALALGTSAGTSPAVAARKALLEALMVWRLVRTLREGGTSTPGRPDTLDQRSRLFWWSSRDRWDDVRWLFEDAEASASEPEDFAGSDDLDALVRWFRDVGEDVLVADLTDQPTLQQLGHHVVATVVPGFHPMHLYEPWPASWSWRLERVARGPLNPDPHPFP